MRYVFLRLCGIALMVTSLFALKADEHAAESIYLATGFGVVAACRFVEDVIEALGKGGSDEA